VAFLASLPSGWWIGPSIGLMGILIGYMLNRRSRIGPRLVYQRGGLRLLGSASPALPEEVEIYFKNHKVPLLTRSYVVLWNSGTQMIRSSDIVSDDPIRINVSQESQVLQFHVITSTRPVIKFQVRSQPCLSNSILCEFDYLDPGDGATIEILHTDKESYPSILGTIRGMPRGLRDWGKAPILEPSLRLNGLRMSIALLAVCTVLVSVLYTPAWDTYLWQSGVIYFLRIITFFLGILSIIPIVWFYLKARRRFPSKLYIDAE
jgi:hypothetical protein